MLNAFSPRTFQVKTESPPTKISTLQVKNEPPCTLQVENEPPAEKEKL